MAAIVGGTLYRRPMEELVFCYGRCEEIIRYIRMRDVHYHPMVMHVHVFSLPLKFFGWFVIPDAIQYNLIFNTCHKICMLISSP